MHLIIWIIIDRHYLIQFQILFLKTKSIYENRVANQIDLFGSDEEQDNEIVLNIEDWNFEDRLSREFEAIGFFISDHPLNQFKEIFDDYKIVDYAKV